MINLRLVPQCLAAVFALAALWPCSPASAQPANHGISEQQAEVSLREVVADFIAKQKELATNDFSSPRVRLYNLVRVYNPKIGWITIAEFDGALVSKKWMPGETQKFYHGIIKIAADESGMPQAPVINEGQGLWESESKVADLHKELQEDVGQWSDWSGNPLAPPSTPAGTAPVVPKVTAPGPQIIPPPVPPSRSSGGNEAITKKYAELNALNARCRDRNNPNMQKDCAEYQRLYQEMMKY
ncbi:hypothetical protein [Rhodopseudomonas pseudopalustris]|uniref:Uncharacterized protein n=1 Tax=Rhodopseudomonas pseudopalustris TaxID=1513892 RepID=A0A1H8SRI1_9BRAD|nr:hypothetical protein [Rhodopseudomonas pseudopalustris]SEO81116.1 hypothetical protein SAMN05444123_10533 [Rhodopseudomonas pseudopalustris]